LRPTRQQPGFIAGTTAESIRNRISNAAMANFFHG
jgi:hypothetical protein